MNKKRISNINDELDFWLFWYVARKNLIFVFLLVSISITAAFLYLRYTYPIYQTEAIIQLDVVENKAQNLFKSDLYDEDLASKLELLRSNLFLKRVLNKLPLKVNYFNKGRFLNFELYKSSPFTIDAFVKNEAIYDQPIFIEFKDEFKCRIKYGENIDKNIYKEFNINETISLPEVDLKISILEKENIQVKNGLLDKNDFFFTINNPENILNTYKNQIKVSILNEAAKTIRINIQGTNPLKITNIANAITDEFKIYDVEKKAESANKVIGFIDNQLEALWDKLYETETKLDNLKKDKNIIENNDSKPLPNIFNRIDVLQDQITKIELEENILFETNKIINENKDIDIYKLIALISVSEYQNSIQNIINTLQELLLKKEQFLYDVTPNSGQISSLNYQIEIQKKLLKESVQSLLNNIKSRKNDLTVKLKDFSNSANSMLSPNTSMEYGRLQRLYEVNEKYYNQLIEKKTEYQISKAGYVSQNQILQEAITPTSAISPIPKSIYLSAIFGAIIFCLLLIIIQYVFFNEIRTINDISKYTNAPILGIIPKYEHFIPVSQLLIDKNPKSIIAESLRTIRTNLQFINNDEGPKIISITSTISGEGKTFVTVNLAGIIALSEKKVIVLDLDLRKPKIHHCFSVENRKGVSSILAKNEKIEDCINHSNIAGLDYITAGPIPPNPSELILNKKLDELIAFLKTKYDFIIFDNPPIGIVADGVKTFQLADYPLYIMKSNYSKKAFIQNIENLITESKINKLSIILNSVDMRFATYSSSATYGYGYGSTAYGYGYYEEHSKMRFKLSLFQRLFNKHDSKFLKLQEKNGNNKDNNS